MALASHSPVLVLAHIQLHRYQPSWDKGDFPDLMNVGLANWAG